MYKKKNPSTLQRHWTNYKPNHKQLLSVNIFNIPNNYQSLFLQSYQILYFKICLIQKPHTSKLLFWYFKRPFPKKKFFLRDIRKKYI